MPRESINVVKASISLNVGDTIAGHKVVGNLSYNYKVVYIDFIYDTVVIVGENGNTDVLSFLDVAGNFHKVVRDDCITIAYSSPKIGDEIVDSDGNKYRVDGINYDNDEIFCSDSEESYTFPFAAFEDGCYKVVR